MTDRAERFDRHPIEIIRDLSAIYGAGIRLSFSRYRVAPPRFQAQMERATFNVDLARATPDWLAHQCTELPGDFELALESRVVMGGESFHIPMIDFAESDPKVVRDSTLEIPGRNRARFACYESGQSFHGYFVELIRATDWPAYLGSLLLLNTPERTVIDPRWVGHSLRRGFSALRWTANTTRYRGLPRFAFDISSAPPIETSRALLPGAETKA